MDLELTGKTALVTGASQGIGRAIADRLAAECCTLHLAARTEAKLATARNEITAAHGGRVTIHPRDLSRTDEVEALVVACGDVDILVNNAGAIPAGDLTRVDDATMRDSFNLKVFGYISLMRTLYPAMCERGSGVIVNIIGMGGERPQAAYIAGAVGNGGLMAMTRALGAESIDHGVRVVGINPGPIETSRLRSLAQTKAEAQFGDASRWRETLTNMPGGRAGKPAEIADTVAYLASARASWISGTVIMVDGGGHSR